VNTRTAHLSWARVESLSLTNYDKLDAGVEKLSLDALEEIDHFLWQAFQREYSKVV